MRCSKPFNFPLIANLFKNNKGKGGVQLKIANHNCVQYNLSVKNLSIEFLVILTQKRKESSCQFEQY